MKNWKEPRTSAIYLANGEKVYTSVNGFSMDDDSAYALVHGRDVKVAPLPKPWTGLGYGEIVSITLQNGTSLELENALSPDDYENHVTYLYSDDAPDATICVYDAGAWREMTEQEYEKERRAWSEDMKDMEQIKREWQEYREG